MKRIFFLLIFCGIGIAYSFAQNESLIVHEWGTITSKHYRDGAVSGHMNEIRPQEVLPDFVYHLDQSILKAFDKNPHAIGHRSVTMRLETPVLYFYPSKKFNYEEPLNISVQFRGGLINEYYPMAVPYYTNLNIDSHEETDIDEDTTGYLYWNEIHLVKQGDGPKTDLKVWLAPRQVQATHVQTSNGEQEQFLFYRGVAHLNSLFKTTYALDTKEIKIYSAGNLVPGFSHSLVPEVWVVDIKEDGSAVYRDLGSMNLSNDSNKLLCTTTINFLKKEYKKENIQMLRESMHKGLIQNGLYHQEATAMLNTWQETYFEQPGTRIFFIVPREWIEYHLPLIFSTPVHMERVLIGRIDLN